MKKLLLPTFLLCTGMAMAQQKPAFVKTEKRNAADKLPTSIVFTEQSAVKKAEADKWLHSHLGFDSKANKAVLTNTSTTISKTTVEKYEQHYKDIRVEYGGYKVLYGADGNARLVNANLYQAPDNTTTKVTVTANDARSIALGLVNAETYAWTLPGMEAFLKSTKKDPNASYFPYGELVWVEDMSSGVGDHKLHLAWKFDVYAMKPLSRENIYIDANTGSVLHRNSLIAHSTGTGPSLYSGTISFQTSIIGGVHTLYDSTRGGGINTRAMAAPDFIVSDITSPSATWASDAALDAHWGTEKVYDYWLTKHGRNSIDGAGLPLNSMVISGLGFDNAFWDGATMYYGDGSGAPTGFSPLVSVDVCAHEIGHGLCQYTAGLIYSGESGALNEGLSDIWGALVEDYADPHEADAQAKNMWHIGEELHTQPLRRMDDPNVSMIPCPDTYGGAHWVSQVGCVPDGGNDGCGVHTNSGVLNHWFYLLCSGGSGTNDVGSTYSVTGITKVKAANIVYQTLLLLTSVANYADFRATSISVAGALYGGCSPELQAVTNAWYAVGVGTDYAGGIMVGGITGSDDPMCTGTPVTLSSTTPGGTWSSSNTAVATVGTDGTVSGLSTGTATITYNVSPLCYATRSVTVNTMPDAGTITGVSGICSAGSTGYTSTVPGGTWSSANSSIVSITSPGGIATGVAAGITTITYSFTNGCGAATTTKSITVNQTPGAITGAGIIPSGSTTTLSNGLPGGTWSSGNLLVATVNPTSGTVYGVANGTANITYTTTGECRSYMTITIGCGSAVGIITTILGNGVPGVGPASGPATSMSIQNPWGVTADAAGNIYVSENTNNLIRKITPSGTASVYTPAYGGYPSALFMAGTDLYFIESSPQRIRKITASGTITTVAGGVAPSPASTADGIPATQAALGNPNSIFVDAAGNIYVSAQYQQKIRKINTAGIITTVAGTGEIGYGGDGGPATAATLYRTTGVIVDPDGNIYISDHHANKIRRVDGVTGIITTYAGTGVPGGNTGDGGPATAAQLNGPGELIFDAEGNLLICDTDNNRIRKVNKATGIITNFAGTGIAGHSGDGGDAALANMQRPIDIAYSNGSYYFSDYANHRARKIELYSVSITGTPTVCVSATRTLTGSHPGGTWASGDPSVATVNSSGVVTGVAAGTAAVSYSIPTGACGLQTAIVTVTVNAADAGIISGAASVCEDSSTTYISSMPGGTWGSSDPLIATVSPGGVVTGIAAGTSTISYTLTGTCGTGYATKIVTVTTLPHAGFSINISSQPFSTNSFEFTNSGTFGAGYTFSWDFGDGSPIVTTQNATHVYGAPGIYTVTHMVCDIVADACGIYTMQVTVTSDSVGGGGGGGLESESLGGLVSKVEIHDMKRSIVRTIDYTKAQHFIKTASNGLAAKGSATTSSVQRFLPAALGGTTPYVNTPSQLTGITAAVDVLAVDYVLNNRAVAVALGIVTRGSVYKHTKSICDRFRGATLLGTEKVTIKGFDLIRFAMRMSDNNVEYCIAFDAGRSAGRNYFALQSNWLISQYAGDDSVFNFQVWAADPAQANKLAQDVLTNLAAVMPVQQTDTAFAQPPAYIATGKRNKGFLDIDITNNTTATSAELRFEERPNELSGTGALSVPLVLVNGRANRVRVPIMDGYEYEGALYLDGKLVDGVYMADGNWSLDYDPTYTDIQQYQTPNEPNRVYADNEYAVYRGVSIKASSSDYISAFKFISGGNMPVNLKTYHTFKFNATGKGDVHIRLIKKGITKWKEQYTAKMELIPGKTEYALSFDDFVSDKKGAPAFDASDVTAVVFTFDLGKQTEFSFRAGELSFSPVQTPSQAALRSKVLSVMPNPSDGTFTLSYVSSSARALDIVVADLTGRILYTQAVQAVQGTNKVKVTLPASIPPSVLILSLGNEGVQYDPVKINVTR